MSVIGNINLICQNENKIMKIVTIYTYAARRGVIYARYRRTTFSTIVYCFYALFYNFYCLEAVVDIVVIR
jgi:hypothetical protein